MESGRKRRVSKGKFISFYRAPKPSVQYANKIIPTPTTPTASLGYLVQDQSVMPSTKPKASSLVKKEGIGNSGSYNDAANSIDTNSEVDRKAANFIAYVQERFKLERIDEDWGNY
ncbi:unnamed protein product [Musa hybrid cultivar]